VTESEARQIRHDRAAPYWAAALAILCAVGVSTGAVHLGAFWKGYVLDMTGPAWTYILIRGRFTAWTDNVWTRFFTPTRTFLLLFAVAFAIEGAQYLDLYEATWDPWDLVAHMSLLLPAYLIDRRTI